MKEVEERDTGAAAQDRLTANGALFATFDALGWHFYLNDALGSRRAQTDAAGNRVEKQGSTVTDTVYFGGQPIARYSGGQWTDLIYGPNGLLAEVPGTQNGVPLYRATDYEGTIVGSLLANGVFVDPVDHTPFGQVFTGNTSDPYLFTGKERDTESGLDYFGARYYASNMGRWMSPDWADKPEAVPYSSLDNPQSLNLYGYVLNNPLSHADADAHCCEQAWNQFAGAVGGVLNIVPQSINLINSAGNAALSLTSTSYRIPMMDEIQSDAHASAGGMAVGQAAQMLVPVGDLAEGAQITRNAMQGAAGEAKVGAELVSEGKTIVGSQVGVQTDKGVVSGGPYGSRWRQTECC